MKTIDIKHIIRTIETMEAKAAEYAEKATGNVTENLDGWYEGRGGAFRTAAEWLRNDLDLFADDIDLTGDAQ